MGGDGLGLDPLASSVLSLNTGGPISALALYPGNEYSWGSPCFGRLVFHSFGIKQLLECC